MVGIDGLCRVRALGVDGVAQLLTGLEEGDALGGDVDLFAGLGVTADAGIALAGTEASKATDFDLVAGLQGSDDGFKQGVDDDFSVAAGKITEGSYFINEISFSHRGVSFRACVRHLAIIGVHGPRG
jgi:hypothetical protein